ncbi:probable amidase At4g34880 [Oryza glaberrima]|uniref:Amidase domain-containing protein n=1 Tax=Oryza glaberrima TaxID=4538 RepID=I1PJ57_ORYGL|nr:probable amidase At4g34880 [Oryza glaberrima]
MARQPALVVVVVAAVALAGGGSLGFEFYEATVDAIQLGFSNGSLTSTALVRFYLDRIDRLNTLLHAVIEVNPDALAQAARADAERATGHRCGPLHGVPVLLKDIIATRDRLNTTAGSLSLLGAVARRDAGVVARLRRAGAVVLGKANLPEWANFRSSPGLRGWSARGGQSRNPYVLSADPCGSSTGPAIAAAANMAAVTVGTETTASILCPAAANSVVGIKPTVGLTSRSGVIPFTTRQDTVGPLCRTVADAVHVLDAIVGYDALDAKATKAASKYIPAGGYVQFLRIDGLKGKRIGIPDGFFDFPNGTVRQMVYKQHLNTMRQQGAVLIENLEIANLSVIFDGTKSGLLTALLAEFKLNLNNYLSDLSYSPVRSLAEIIAFNNAHPVEEELKEHGQSILLMSENTAGIGPAEKAAIRRLNELSVNGVEKLMNDHQLDAIVTPDSAAAVVLAFHGLPGVVVPAGYDEKGVPFGVCFGGLKGYEPRLIEMAYAFEQVTKVRMPPMFKP